MFYRESILDYMQNKDSSLNINDSSVKTKISEFIKQFRLRWKKSSNNKNAFLKYNKEWLALSIHIPKYVTEEDGM